MRWDLCIDTRIGEPRVFLSSLTGLICGALIPIIDRPCGTLPRNPLSDHCGLGTLCPLYMEQVNLGLVGGGIVGGGVCHALHHKASLLASRLGVRLHLTRIAI